MNESDRVSIIKELGFVDEVFLSIDKDKSVSESLRAIKPDIFANGGDRHVEEVPEAKVCRECGIEMVDGVGAKIRSSSGLIGGNKGYIDLTKGSEKSLDESKSEDVGNGNLGSNDFN